MYISKINIENFRNFKNKEILFNEGINVIIGHNNAGKTNLLKAISLIIDYQGPKRLGIDDFNKTLSITELKTAPPKISISLTLSKGEDNEDDDLVTIANWLTKLDPTYEALLTYEFFLPEKEKVNYLRAVENLDESDPNVPDKAWKIIKNSFIRLYVFKIWGGNLVNQAVADNESLQKFDFQFLDAIRDVERNMLTGKNTLLKEVFDFFIDYDIKKDSSKTDEEKTREIEFKTNSFSEKADELIQILQERMTEGKNQILSYANETGATFNNAKPNFEGNISEVDMFSALKLIIEYNSNLKVPATHNGLGYNNLIFMSLLLAKMQVNSDGQYMGSNSKVFAILAIEEPEAHLHPSMQYKFLKFLRDNRKQRKVRQIFVTSHSTHITSAISLDEIICLYDNDGITNVGYPGKVFPDDVIISKKYVQRFLDATKSDMLFAKKVVFVEGIAEQLLLSIFARYLDFSLEDSHVAVINVGGRYFDHFLYMFDSTKEYTVNKKIVCITDRDPESKRKTETKFKKCYPYEYNTDTTNCDYKTNDSALNYLINIHPNITFFSQNDLGKTFEYDLVFNNPSCKLLLTDSIRNKDELGQLMDLYNTTSSTLEDFFEKLRNSDENEKIIKGIENNTQWNVSDKKKAIIASRYLNSVDKGVNALEIAIAIKDNFDKKGTSHFQDFKVPDYIKQAIEFICQ